MLFLHESNFAIAAAIIYFMVTCKLYLSGFVNSQIYRIWSAYYVYNPHNVIEDPSREPSPPLTINI
jgi:hypothetical protein